MPIAQITKSIYRVGVWWYKVGSIFFYLEGGLMLLCVFFERVNVNEGYCVCLRVSRVGVQRGYYKCKYSMK